MSPHRRGSHAATNRPDTPLEYADALAAAEARADRYGQLLDLVGDIAAAQDQAHETRVLTILGTIADHRAGRLAANMRAVTDAHRQIRNDTARTAALRAAVDQKPGFAPTAENQALRPGSWDELRRAVLEREDTCPTTALPTVPQRHDISWDGNNPRCLCGFDPRTTPLPPASTAAAVGIVRDHIRTRP